MSLKFIPCKARISSGHTPTSYAAYEPCYTHYHWTWAGLEYISEIRSMLLEVIPMVDLSQDTIRSLLYKQARALSVRREHSFDLQFSDRWIK